MKLLKNHRFESQTRNEIKQSHTPIETTSSSTIEKSEFQVREIREFLELRSFFFARTLVLCTALERKLSALFTVQYCHYTEQLN